MTQLPLLILLTDDTPSRNGAGIRQTLYNLLVDYPSPIFQLSFPEELELGRQPDMLSTTVVLQSAGPFRPWANRLGAWVNRVLQPWQLAWLAKAPICNAGLPDSGNSLVLVSTSSAPKLVLAGNLHALGYRVVPYFMDDWMAGNTLSWKGGNIQQIAKNILQKAPAWLMISDNLKQELMQRYRLKEKPCLVVHNPAPATLPPPRWGEAGGSIGDGDLVGRSTFLPSPGGGDGGGLIIYAGSIWPMHADALIAVAKAIHLLQGQGHTQYRLQLHTSPRHWQQYQAQLAGPGVTYGGWLPYQDIHPALQQGWLLLCTASFQQQFAAFSKSSTQTKLTDYMAAAKPILMVGPAHSASSAFVETWDCGYTMATNLPVDIAERICTIAALPALYHRKAANSRLHASTTFSKEAVQQRLYHFLENIG